MITSKAIVHWCLIVAGASASLPFVACNQNGTTNLPDAAPVTLSADGGFAPVDAPVADGSLPNGVLYALTVTAKGLASSDAQVAPIQGLLLTFGTTTTGTSGVLFSPTSVATNAWGQATSYVAIPYGTHVEAIVSGGGAITSASAGATAVQLDLGSGLVPATEANEPLTVPTGAIYSLTVTAREAPPAMEVIAGLPIAFATTTNGTSGVTFSPATVNTNSQGRATSYVTVPYGTQVKAVVSGGGTVRSTSTELSPLTLNIGGSLVMSQGAPALLPTGAVYAVTATATSTGSGDAGVAGVSIAFVTTTNGSTTGVTFSPASVLTNATGQATSYVTIPYGAEVEAIVSTGAAVAAQYVVAPTVTLTPDLVQPPGGTTPGAPCVSSSLCELTVNATAVSTPIQGLAVTAGITAQVNGSSLGSGSGSSSIIAPPALVTVDGAASFTFYVPQTVAGFTVTVSGGGANNSTYFGLP